MPTRTTDRCPTPVTHRVEHTTPIYRLVAVILAAAAAVALGYYAQAIHRGDDFATVVVIATGFTLGFWARKRPDRMRARFGPFGRIAEAARESHEDIQAWVYSRPLRAGLSIAIAYGVVVVLAKHLVLTLLSGLWSWQIAVAAGCAIGAIVIAPHLWSGAIRRMRIGDDEHNDRED